MKYYLEINLLPNADIGMYFIWQKLFQQMHLALAENKSADNASAIGVAFPGYDAVRFALGTKLRLFAESEQLLMQIQCKKWLNRLSDYVHVSGIKPVPEKVTGHACFRHVKMKGGKEKLARRWAKRHGDNFEQALALFSDYKEKRTKLPYINMISQTNGQRFRLFIEKQVRETPQEGLYSCYGLSNSTTVPVF